MKDEEEGTIASRRFSGVALAARPPVVLAAAARESLADKPTTVRLEVEQGQLVRGSGRRVLVGLLI
jgi:hypothetical protein